MSTPHIRAARGEIAPRVVMPGDPRRAERIARERLDDARLVTDVRGILGFTGAWRGEQLTVMASGMGMPSLTIYATELVREYGVQRIIRVGTAGGIPEHVRVGDVVIATGAHTDSNMTAARLPGVQFSHVPAHELVTRAAATPVDAAVHLGTVFTTDHFYLERPALLAALADHGTLATEMEAAALYAVGAAEGVQTLAVVTVTDHLLTGESLTADERETRFHSALDIALAALVS